MTHACPTPRDSDINLLDFGFVSKYNIDFAIVYKRLKIGAMTGDAETGGESEGDRTPRLACNINGGTHRGSRFFGIPEIAFQKQDFRGCNEFGVQCGSRKKLRCAQEGVHGAVCIGREEDQAACCRWFATPWLRPVVYP